MDGPSIWVDDHHPIFLAGMVAALRGEGLEVVGSSTKLIEGEIPSGCDVLVFDARNDEQIGSMVRLGISAVAVVQQGSMEQASAAVQAGVNGLLIRQEITPRRIVSAVRAAWDGSWTCPSDLADRLLAVGSAGGTSPFLSDREQQVLELLASGMSTQEIADKMAYSPRTIKNQVQSILMKLNCRNRAHAVGEAVRQGWI